MIYPSILHLYFYNTGIYQYVAVIDKINASDIIDIDNTTDEVSNILYI